MVLLKLFHFESHFEGSTSLKARKPEMYGSVMYTSSWQVCRRWRSGKERIARTAQARLGVWSLKLTSTPPTNCNCCPRDPGIWEGSRREGSPEWGSQERHGGERDVLFEW